VISRGFLMLNYGHVTVDDVAVALTKPTASQPTGPSMMDSRTLSTSEDWLGDTVGVGSS
jgi:hypothetical protein